MEVKLKISTDTLIALGRWISLVNSIKDSRGINKVYVSIGLELSDRFEKKCRTIERQTSIFDSKKKYSTKFKYHEAWALKELLIGMMTYVRETNQLHYTLLSKLINELDQKLV